MPTNESQRIARRSWLWALALAMLPLTCGCHLWKQAEEPSPTQSAEDSIWSSHLRQPTAQGQQLGLDARAREIERNLGIR